MALTPRVSVRGNYVSSRDTETSSLMALTPRVSVRGNYVSSRDTQRLVT